MKEQLLTVKDLAEYLQVSKSLVYKWVHYGFVPYVKVGSLLRFNATQIENWIKKREKRGRSAYRIEVL